MRSRVVIPPSLVLLLIPSALSFTILIPSFAHRLRSNNHSPHDAGYKNCISADRKIPRLSSMLTRGTERNKAPKLFLVTARDTEAMETISHDISSSSPPKEKINRTALYVHIPYCRRRCHYCDFAIVPIGDATPRANAFTEETKSNVGFEQMDMEYRTAILKELSSIKKTFQDPKQRQQCPAVLQSIYFGGGTPSLAPIQTIQAILNTIEETFCIDPDAEITMEMDPGTFDISQLRAYKKIGINRISLGVQSFDNSILSHIGRVHRQNDCLEAIRLIREVYDGDDEVNAANWSMDLMSGLPGLTLAKWAETLEYAVTVLQPEHLSVYDLQIEKGTKFGRVYGKEQDRMGWSDDDAIVRQEGSLMLPNPEDSAFMYRYASAYLRAKGYDHYEISSYAKIDNQNGDTSKRSRHNSIYWEIDAQWYAVGLGATSSLGGKRLSRPRKFSDYISWVKLQTELLDEEQHELDDNKNKEPTRKMGPPIDDDEEQSDRLGDTIMTRLRTSDGLDLHWVRREYGQNTLLGIIRGVKLYLEIELVGFIFVGEEEEGGDTAVAAGNLDGNNPAPELDLEDVNLDVKGWWLRLSDPNGFLFSNTIISNIFLELDDIGARLSDEHD